MMAKSSDTYAVVFVDLWTAVTVTEVDGCASWRSGG